MRRLRAGRARPGCGRDGVGDEDLRCAHTRVARALLAVELLPGQPRRGVCPGVGGASDQRRIGRIAVRVDVQRRGGTGNLLAFVDPLAATLRRRRLGHEPAREDLRVPAERIAWLRPADPRNGPVGAGEVDRRGLRDLGRVLVEGLGEPLCLPGAALERADEDLLAAIGVLLKALRERGPRNPLVTGRHRARRQVGQTGVLPWIDRGGGRC